MGVKSMKDAIANVAKKTGVNKTLTQTVVESFLSEIGETIEQEDSLVIKGFGTFSMKKQAARTGRNIKTGEEILIPEKSKPHFKPSKNFSVYPIIHKL